MKGVIIHASLLAVMLVYGYVTWTKDKSIKPTSGEVVMWTRSENEIKTIEFATADRTVRIERRGEGAGAYWWGTETRTTKTTKPRLKKPPVTPDPATGSGSGSGSAAGSGSGSGSAATPPPPEPELPPEEVVSTTTREFPIGEPGEKLIKDLASMRALKSIGVIKEDAKKDYELVDTSKTISIVFASGAKTLVLGGRVYGGSDRYIQDVDTNKGFVISGSLVTPLEGGEGSLRPTDVRSFDPKAAMQVEIAAAGKTKSVSRIKVKRPDDQAAEDPHMPKPPGTTDMIETWGTGTTADTAAANFIDKVEQLRPTSFEPGIDLKSLSEVVSLTYRDGQGKVLGTLKVLKKEKPGTPPPPPTDPNAGPPPPVLPEVDYFIVTERTRVASLVPKVAAERIVPDISTIFPQ